MGKFGRYGLVVDTEGYSNQPFYNIGWNVVDLENYESVECFSGCIPETLAENLTEKQKRLISNNPENKALGEMYHNNLYDILKGFNTKYVYVPSSRGMYQRLLNVIKKYQIKDIFAYNFPFDRGAFKRTFKEKSFENLDKLLTFHDIQTMIFYTHCYNLDYVNFCLLNGFLTDKGNISTTAENIYRYIFNDIDFKEEHTALSDVFIESDLLFEAIKKNPDVETKHTAPYAKLNKLFENTPENRLKMLGDLLFE